MYRKLVICSLSAAIVGVLCAYPVFAGIGAAPGRLELRLTEGSEQKGVWTVINTSDKPIRVDVDVEDWLKVGPDSIKNPKHWLKIKTAEFVLGPNSKKEVEYMVKVAKGLDGEAVAMVFFTSSNVEGPAPIVKPRFGSILYLINKGTEKLAAEIEDIKLSKYKKGIKADIKIRNYGNVHIRPEGDVWIEDTKGNRLLSAPFPYGWPVQPKRSRLYSAFIEDAKLKAGKFKAMVKIKFGTLYERKEEVLKAIEFSVEKEGSIKIE